MRIGAGIVRVAAAMLMLSLALPLGAGAAQEGLKHPLALREQAGVQR